MVLVWYMDSSEEDRRLEHHRDPKVFLTLDELFKKTGVEYFKIDLERGLEDDILCNLKTTRGISFVDVISCSSKCPASRLKGFYDEHLHTGEEIRLTLEGGGYFDVRDKNDEWIRIAVPPGDLIIIPPGIYHRFTLDTNNYIKGRRFFIGEPEWASHNRPAEEMECRQKYLDHSSAGFDRILVK